MKKVREIRQQLKDIMASSQLKIILCGTDWDVVRKYLCFATVKENIQVVNGQWLAELDPMFFCVKKFNKIKNRES